MYWHLFINNEKVGVINQDVLLKANSDGFQQVGVGSLIQLNDYNYKIVALKDSGHQQQPGPNLQLEIIN